MKFATQISPLLNYSAYSTLQHLNRLVLFSILFQGLQDWSESDVLTQVLAASQQEYLDSLKKIQQQKHNSDHVDSGLSSGSGQEQTETSPGEGPTVPESVPASDKS